MHHSLTRQQKIFKGLTGFFAGAALAGLATYCNFGDTIQSILSLLSFILVIASLIYMIFWRTIG